MRTAETPLDLMIGIVLVVALVLDIEIDLGLVLLIVIDIEIGLDHRCAAVRFRWTAPRQDLDPYP